MPKSIPPKLKKNKVSNIKIKTDGKLPLIARNKNKPKVNNKPKVKQPKVKQSKVKQPKVKQLTNNSVNDNNDDNYLKPKPTSDNMNMDDIRYNVERVKLWQSRYCVEGKSLIS